ncbi:endo-alpha-N-acetylgalactosaminidase family protein [Paenibacillus dokdonensis]|uniref:endo-alpha-N-acetylgalactosaminidase family protein n=1 Tax=Paenibacillus dokdonensis TaxID=2567944 RepID=UPI001457A8B3|nr:endo-alpha-N-acetylgalactosaminidase family protein [Paenibacillus dokdonensis]
MRKNLLPFGIFLSALFSLQLCFTAGNTFAAGDSDVYFKDYNDGNISGWTSAKGTTTFSADNGTVKAVTQGAVIFADLESPQFANGDYEVKLKFNQTPTRFGLVYRYVDKDNYNVIQFDTNSWGWDSLKNGAETYGSIPSTSPTFAAGQQYAFKLHYENDSIQLSVDGNSVFNTTLPGLPASAGKIGLRSWFDNKTINIDDVKLTKVDAVNPDPKPISVTDTLTSSKMKVEIDKEFPRVKKYIWNGSNAEMNGQLNGINELKINGKSYYPTALSYLKKEAAGEKGETAVYTLLVPGINVKLVFELELKDNVLQFKVTDLQENGTEKVKTLEFPNHDLVSVLATEPKAQETAAWVTGDWVAVKEEYKDLKAGATDVSGGRTFGFLNSDKLAAAVITNVVNAYDKVRVKIGTDTVLNTQKAALSGGAWTYRGSTVLDPEPLPWAKIVLTPDANGDESVDWQDAAIAYRDHAETPYGSDMIRDNISYISMNIGSTTSSPFLRAFDNAKKIYNLTDGFGQLILFKGYQAEGHDDSHPDYGGHIGIRQGGKEDFNYVLSEGKKYNIHGGVHINATEYMLDAFETKMENLTQPLSKGWGWLDQAYYVNKTKDVESGELKRRLDMLKADTGNNLSFVYVDVYSGADYNAKKLAEYINGNGWMLGTEYAGPIYEQAAWVHWGTDPGYPNQGNDSKITRFIRNQYVDGFLSNPLLKGNKQVGVGYWQNSSSFYSYKTTTAAFFNQNLPTKYMQYFPIMKMTNDRIDFGSNVAVQRGQDGKIHLSKDGHDIAIMTDSSEISDSTVFIPWDPVKEDKIYHWNPAGGQSTWTLPASWSNVTTAQLYKLTDLGRERVGTVDVNGGKVTLTAEKGTGYVLYKSVPQDGPEVVWGDGSPVKDPGFDSQKFGSWQKSSSAGNTDHIQYVKNNNADDQLQVKGPGDATIHQVITGLTPGKTYSASVWVNISGKRKVEIGVNQGNDTVNNYLDNTDHKFLAQQHKYVSTNFQRIKVNFDAVSNQATLYLKVDEGSAAVTFDDVRVWGNPTKTDAGDSVFYEDFENVDEGWGPFVYSKLGPVRTHLAEKGGNQIQSYVLDGKYSLKTNEEGTGEWLRTLPHTLRLQEDNKYHLTLDYNSDELDMYTVAVRVNENGTVRDLASENLKEGRNKLDLTFTTEGAKDAYLAIIKNKVNNQKDLTGTLVLDDIRVNDEGAISPEEGVKVTKITLTPQNIELNRGQSSQITARVEPSNAYDRTVLWSSDKPDIVSVDQTGKVTAHLAGTAVVTATAKDGSKVTGSVTVKVYEPNTLIPQSQMSATATSFQPGDEPANALDGDPETIWHTKWTPAHLPESITLNLGGSYKVNQLNYTPRSGAGNGTITGYNLYASTDGVEFTKIATGSWIRDDKVKSVRFDAVDATHLKLEAIEGVGSFASAAEIQVFNVLDTSEEVKVTGVTINKKEVTLKEGETAELTAAVLPENATNKNVSWNTSDENVAAVEVNDGRTIVTGKAQGTADITVTTADGKFTDVSRITVQKKDGNLEEATVLTAPSQVQSGAEFRVQFGLRNIKHNVFAQDIEFTYDTAVMDFVSAKSLLPGVNILETQRTGGKMRLIVASEGADHAVSGNADLFELTFKAKEASEPVSGNVAVNKATISDELGTEYAAASSKATVEVGGKITNVGDVNGDGKVSIGDLAIIAAHYGKTSSSPDWQQAKKADINGDGVIGLEDLVLVAKKIVG